MKNFAPRASLLLIPLIAFATACTSPSSKNAADSSSSSGKETRVVNLAIWANYLTPEQVSEFERKTGIKVGISNYASNEELLAKLQAGASGYDVVVPSDYMVGVMKKLHLLVDLDRSQLSNSKELDQKVLGKAFDPENKVSLPLDWGSTGIAVNRKLYKGEIRGWKDLLQNKEVSGKVTMLDDVRESLGAALKAEALSINTTQANDLQRGKVNLLKLKEKLKGFTSEPQPGLINGEMAVAHAYSCDALQARSKSQGQIDYIIPEEGGTLWIDNLVIPTGAKHLKEAHALINYLLDPQVQAARAQTLFVAPSNTAAFPLLPQELANNKSIFPDEATLKRLEMIQDLGDQLTQWDRIWTEVKASR